MSLRKIKSNGYFDGQKHYSGTKNIVVEMIVIKQQREKLNY